MQVNRVNNHNNTNFGHSFRVSISLKDANGIPQFINPAENSKLYKTLNSKIVGWLNEDFNTNLRNIYNRKIKVQKTAPKTEKHREMVSELRAIDDDYRRFNLVRTEYRKNKLGYIATGADVSIIENIKGVKQIGIAKADSIWNYGDSHSEYVKTLCKAVKNNSLNFVQHDNVLLRSPRNKEIMLRATFKEAGKNKFGTILYELDNYEFHENRTKRTLAPVNPYFIRFKNSLGMLEEIKKTIQYQANKILKRNIHFEDINEILNPKIESPQISKIKEAPKTIIKKIKQKKQTLQTPQPKQLEFNFKD